MQPDDCFFSHAHLAGNFKGHGNSLRHSTDCRVALDIIPVVFLACFRAPKCQREERIDKEEILGVEMTICPFIIRIDAAVLHHDLDRRFVDIIRVILCCY